MRVKNDILSIHDPRVVLDKGMNVVVACSDNENI